VYIVHMHSQTYPQSHQTRNKANTKEEKQDKKQKQHRYQK
jgi:hypothetical protein